MKKYLIIPAALFAITLAAPHAFAQDTTTAPAASSDTTTPPPTAKHHGGKKGKKGNPVDAQLADLTTALNLTQDQQDKIRPILQNEFDQGKAAAAAKKAAKADAATPPADGSTTTASADTAPPPPNMKKLRKQSDHKIRAILTPDQQTKYDAMPKAGKGGKKSAPPASDGSAPASSEAAPPSN